MTERSSQPVLDEVRRMLRAFEGPATPRPNPARPRLVRTLLAGATAAVALGAAGLAIGLLAEGTATREARPRTVACGELRLEGRRYVARRVPAGALAPAARLGSSAVLVCGDRRVPGVGLVRIAGVDPAAALVRPAAPGVVYVAAGLCPSSRTQAQLLACLRRSG